MSASELQVRTEQTEDKSLPVWVRPDFSEYDTPMEVTAYSGRA
ncbi:hypothetical protein GCM10010174_23120 [Kutzneria viridogrisea]|uniref:Coenzyme PQQ synthesis protein A n=2 Tax=Kutzneria TaxID=43356 RepID=W5W064_9PSEU|nr:hypothetical protein KALB_833 [Kutzneria albida DSM 43870]MBA8929880.1 coenzyme PQQ precursor peptide PqqA [Kutzneria viridogrisea]